MKNLAFVFLLSLLSMSAKAQITITEVDYINFETDRANGTIDTAINPSVLSPILGQGGANQTWDFTAASFNVNQGKATYVFVPYSDTILGATNPDFSSATFVGKSPAITINGLRLQPSNEFFKVTSSGAWDLGGCDDSDGIPGKLLSLSPPVEIMPFPLTYQAAWQSTSKQDGSDVSIYNATQTQIEVVDGYGTLILPNHSGNALRVMETFIIKDSVQGFEAADTDVVYNFYTTDGYSAEIFTFSGSIVNASYTVPSSSAVISSPTPVVGLRLSFTQNPESNSGTNIIYTLPNAGSVQVELMDELGRNVRMLQNGFAPAGQNTIAIDPQFLDAGTYFVRVVADRMRTMQKLVVIK